MTDLKVLSESIIKGDQIYDNITGGDDWPEATTDIVLLPMRAAS